ncbi:hypothetical protein CLCR_08291 [Cladophialophora carrionii]|uniref:CorA-like transporter domain-containing protein n=1 Tax=Cladophialophora carrionii TaxID=86049 RepID=A0A1C1CRV6_9EURO|nr:hypothetical protein CLCR_08291 [Cladophialophora carrionii]
MGTATATPIGLNLTTEFISSYREFASFPENLFDRHSYAPTLRAYKHRLDLSSAQLLVQHEDVADVPFRDLDGTGAVLARKNIFSDQKLREHLGDNAGEDPSTSRLVSGAYATKPDPQCRFIFFWAKHSRAPLKLTRRMLMRIMSYHQVMPRYLEFLFLFGQRAIPHDLRYSGFREQTSLELPAPGQNLPELRRSGKHYQICYNLKSVGCSSPPDIALMHQQWSIRHAAIYHQFDVEFGTTLWIVTKGDLSLKEDVQDVTGPNGRPEDRSFGSPQEAFRASLPIHALFAHWATNDWRWYMQWLEDSVDKETQATILENRNEKVRSTVYTPSDLQRIQIWEEKANEVITTLESNASVLGAILDYYLALAQNAKFPLRSNNADDFKMFAAQLKDLIADSNMQKNRAKLLVNIASQRKILILQYLQSQASEKMETLTMMAQKEAVAMRIVTVVTLIYLPATFVSTFFSTDVVKYQNGSGTDPTAGGTSYSSVAMARWLEVTLPLTVVTFLLSWLAYNKAKKNIGVQALAKGIFGHANTYP